MSGQLVREVVIGLVHKLVHRSVHEGVHKFVHGGYTNLLMMYTNLYLVYTVLYMAYTNLYMVYTNLYMMVYKLVHEGVHKLVHVVHKLHKLVHSVLKLVYKGVYKFVHAHPQTLSFRLHSMFAKRWREGEWLATHTPNFSVSCGPQNLAATFPSDEPRQGRLNHIYLGFMSKLYQLTNRWQNIGVRFFFAYQI